MQSETLPQSEPVSQPEPLPQAEGLPQPEAQPQPGIAERDNYVLAVVSLVLGIVGLCAWLVPICGLPLAVVGVILGVLGRRSSYPNIATAGIVLCGLGVIASIANWALGAYLALTGQFQLFQ